MEQGLSISIVLHLALLGFLFWSPSSENPRTGYTNIEMVSLVNNQRPQRQRIKGQKKRAPVKTPEILDSAPFQTDKKGQDQEDAPALQGGSTDPQLLAVASYAQELERYIASNLYYPRRALVMEQTGTVKVRLTINAKGEFIRVEVIESSEYEILNRAAKDLFTELAPFKPLPKAYRGNGEFTIPINYRVDRGI